MRKIALRRGMMVALAIIAGIFLLSPGLTLAGVGASDTPTVTTPVTVGQTGVGGWSFTIENAATTGNETHSMEITSMFFITSCGSSGVPGNCLPGDQEPANRITIDSPATGEAGTACAGVTFTVAATGNPNEYSFTPLIPPIPVILGPKIPGGSLATCKVNFTVNINNAPTKDSSGATGLQTSQHARVQLIDTETDETGGGTGTSTVTVVCNPTIVTTPDPSSGFIGAVLKDSATLADGCNPTGTITFKLFGVNDQTCGSAPIFTKTVTVSGNGLYSTPTGFTTVEAGTYHWIATYGGDVSNNGVSSICANEAVTIDIPIGLRTIPDPSSGPVNTVLKDSAVLTGGVNPTGTITFKLFGPNDLTCSGTPIFTNTVAVSGDGTYNTSAGFTATAAGTYNWVATYSGDSNNPSITDKCGNEMVVITQIRISTKPIPSSARLGNVPPLKDSATLADGVNPTGTITFNLFDLSDPNCGGPPIFTNTVNVNGNGTYNTSAGFTGAVAEGTYHWTATYSGDTNNNSVSSTCADEPVMITNKPPGGSGEGPYIGIVGNDMAFNPFYFSEKHQQFLLDQEAVDVPVCWSAFPPVTQYTRVGGNGCEQFRSNKPINQPEICDTTGQVIDFAKGDFIHFGEPNAVITKQNAGWFEWFIRLPKKPNGEINICIQCGVLKPNTFTPFTGFYAVEECAAETGERIGRGWCTQNQVEPPSNPIINSALPRITAIVYPGPQAPVDFKPFHLTAYKNPGTYNLSANTAGAMTNGNSLQVLDGSTNARVLLKSCMDKCVIAKIPVTGQANILGETESDLESGDLIYVRMDVPVNNTVDIFCHSQSTKIAGVGEGAF